MPVAAKAFLLYWTAGASLIAAWWLPHLVGACPALPVLRVLGWAVWTCAIALIWASMISPRSKAIPQQRDDQSCASITFRGGIYAIVRHPRYLGWLLLYVAVIMLAQHWLALICAIPGIVCMCLISRVEDRRLVYKLGPAYEQYMRCVPTLNPLTGLARLLRDRLQRLP